MNFLRDLDVLLLGLGESGLAMARWCLRHGARVRVWDSRAEPPGAAALAAEHPGVTVFSGALGQTLQGGPLADVRLILKSPGLAPSDERIAALLGAARASGIAVMNEVDLFVHALADLKARTKAEDEAAAAEASTAAAAETSASAEAGGGAADADADAASRADADAVAVVGAEADADAVANDDADTDADAGAREAPAEPQAEAPSADEPPIAPPPPPAIEGYAPRLLAITGTNGKTTTTALTALLVERSGRRAQAAGNISPSMLDALTAMLETPRSEWIDVWVLELSSFQLADMAGPFEPHAATVLNVSQDHLDWHGSMAAYADAKARIFGTHGLMVLNADDARVEAMLPAPVVVKQGKGPRTRHVAMQRAATRFGLEPPAHPGDFGLVVENGMAWLVRALPADETLKRRKDEDVEIHLQRLMPADALRVRGRHNAANALAALALATAIGCPLAPMLHGLREYTGEPHRVQPIGSIGGVEAIDDTKGTNVGATVAALVGLGADRAPAKLLVILGGDGKGQDFTPLAAPVQRHARAVALIGRDAHAIAAALADTGVPLTHHESLPDAVAACFAAAQAGDVVLLSPACASLDMFRNYKHRGEVFAHAVQALATERGEVLA